MPARIMVINDTKEILELFEELLTEEGYDVTCYSYGMHDLVEIKRVMPDLIILDYLIGDEKAGWQLLQKLKMDRTTARIPIIVCSGAVKQLRELEGWLSEKGIGTVLKPFEIDDLLTEVRRMLQGIGTDSDEVAAKQEQDKP
jgi:DNA-binding response OmpR family regulator